MILLNHIFSKKATKIDEIFTVDLTLCSKCQIDGEDFVNFCGLLRNVNFNFSRKFLTQSSHMERRAEGIGESGRVHA